MSIHERDHGRCIITTTLDSHFYDAMDRPELRELIGGSQNSGSTRCVEILPVIGSLWGAEKEPNDDEEAKYKFLARGLKEDVGAPETYDDAARRFKQAAGFFFPELDLEDMDALENGVTLEPMISNFHWKMAVAVEPAWAEGGDGYEVRLWVPPCPPGWVMERKLSFWGVAV